MKLDMTKLRHMDITEMPSDPSGYLGKLRATLRGAYNSNRSNHDVMVRLKDTLQYTLSMIEAAEAPAKSSSAALEAPSSTVPGTSSQKKPAKRTDRAAQR